MKKVLLMAVTLLFAFGSSGCSYNELTEKQQIVKGKWADVESSMQRRADLLPNLFQAAKAAGFNEQTVFGKIADARTKLAGAQKAEPKGSDGNKSPEQKQEIWKASGDLSRLLVLFENYPVLRSNEAFMKVQDEVAGTENRIDISRKDYSDAVASYNTTRNQFPGVLTASIMGFKEEPYFNANNKEVPKLDANDMKGDK